MSDQHLINTIRMLLRVATADLHENISAAYSALFSLQGEMAQFYCEQDIDRMEDTSPEELLSDKLPIFDRMILEAKRRGLKYN